MSSVNKLFIICRFEVFGETTNRTRCFHSAEIRNPSPHVSGVLAGALAAGLTGSRCGSSPLTSPFYGRDAFVCLLARVAPTGRSRSSAWFHLVRRERGPGPSGSGRTKPGSDGSSCGWKLDSCTLAQPRRQKVRGQTGPLAIPFWLRSSCDPALQPGFKLSGGFSQGLVSQSGTWRRSQRGRLSGWTQVCADPEIRFPPPFLSAITPPIIFPRCFGAATFPERGAAATKRLLHSGLRRPPAWSHSAVHHHLVIQHLAQLSPLRTTAAIHHGVRGGK